MFDTQSVVQRLQDEGVDQVRAFDDPAAAVAQIAAIWEDQVGRLQRAVRVLSDGGSDGGLFLTAYYPLLAFAIGSERPVYQPGASHGFCRRGPGVYSELVCDPGLFGGYLIEQLTLLRASHPNRQIFVGQSSTPIPLPFVIDTTGVDASVVMRFTQPTLDSVGDNDDVVAGDFRLTRYSGPRIGNSLRRLVHYCGTAPKHFQRFVILTNYQFYIDAFVEWAKRAVGSNGYLELVTPRGWGERGWEAGVHIPQMPAFHLVQEDGLGITMINIGVGPSNAKTMVDHLAPLRPHAVLMMGHCGGLRPEQNVGDFVLADGYVRDDGVMDRYVSLTREDIPPIGEINAALKYQVREAGGLSDDGLLRIVSTGTVWTTSNRNWELDPNLRAEIAHSTALAIDMESATVAAACHWHRIPHGTLLRISDRPEHAELKGARSADDFYTQSKGTHLRAVIGAIEQLRHNPTRLHSRKMRSPQDTPFR